MAFLTELKTRMLTGTHDADKIEGALVLFEAAEEISFVGMGGRDKHSYKGDLTGRDDGGVILTMISGPDEKTCLTEETRHPFTWSLRRRDWLPPRWKTASIKWNFISKP